MLQDGTLASGRYDYTIRLWDTTKGISTKTLRGNTNNVWCLAVLQDGTLASGSGDNTIRLWDTTKGISTKTLSGHKTMSGA